MSEATVIDRYLERLTLDLSIDEYRRIPRNAAYKYEYFDDAAQLTPRPKPRHARIATDAPVGTDDDPSLIGDTVGDLQLRALADADRDRLVTLFAAAFEHVAPFGALSEGRRREAAAEAIADTLGGRDGPLVEAACRVATDTSGRPLGACLVTLSPRSPLVVEPMRDRPHLTWIFVAPLLGRRGLGGALLRDALGQLRAAGHAELFTTFLVGNEASTMWHWERGFELLANPYSMRGYRKGRAGGA